MRTGRSSDLSQDNLIRVAASSIQIREVLLKDAGLLVELKRWVAQEATNNGQVVEDSTLLDRPGIGGEQRVRSARIR